MSGTFRGGITFGQVEKWILDLANSWYDEYLADMEREVGEPARTFKRLADWGIANDFDKWPEERLPFLLVMYTGLSEPPSREGDGTWRATGRFATAIIASANTRSDTRWAMHTYGAALKTMMLQNKDLGHPEHVQGLTWIDERPAPIPSDGERSLGAIQLYFDIEVRGLLNDRGTPPSDEPRPDPYDPPADPAVITKAFLHMGAKGDADLEEFQPVVPAGVRINVQSRDPEFGDPSGYFLNNLTGDLFYLP